MRQAMKAIVPLRFLLAMTILLGFAYPAALTAICQLAFPAKAKGSLLVEDGSVRGSYLLAQEFSSPRYFKARPSATDYAYVGSGASNLGPTSAALAAKVAERRSAWEAEFGSPAPEEMLYASASGLDPDISEEAALAQAPVVAAARNLGYEGLAALKSAVGLEARLNAGLLGHRRVNVVRLNALLDSDPRYRDREEASHVE